MTRPFFSIIVPAHNEERYIQKTLEHVRALAYPTDRYEVLVVENGSTDATRVVAESIRASHIRVLSYAQSGVSFARNKGLEHMSPLTDWVVFLDADTLVMPHFLSDIEQACARGKRPTAGTTRVQPLSNRMAARAWFRIYDVVHAVFHNSWAVFFADAAVAREIGFNERAVLMEDQQFLAAATRRGSFRYVPTKTVFTSTRRFDKDGWLRPVLLYLYVGLLPKRIQERFTYGVVR